MRHIIKSSILTITFLFLSNLSIGQYYVTKSDYQKIQKQLISTALKVSDINTLNLLLDKYDCAYEYGFTNQLKNHFEEIFILNKSYESIYNNNKPIYKSKCFSDNSIPEDFQGFSNTALIDLIIHSISNHKNEYGPNENTSRLSMFEFCEFNDGENTLISGPSLNTGIHAIQLSLLYHKQEFYIYEEDPNKLELIESNIKLYNSDLDLSNLSVIKDSIALYNGSVIFDKVILNQNLHHLNTPAKDIELLKGVMKPGAEFILFEATKVNPHYNCSQVMSKSEIIDLLSELNLEETRDFSILENTLLNERRTTFIRKGFKIKTADNNR